MAALEIALRAAVGFAPVAALLVVLTVLDGYKLVTRRAVARSVVGGALAAAIALGVNDVLRSALDLDSTALVRYVAPLVEEALKASVLLVLIRGHRAGFLVDAGIHGFAVGTGFALAENLHFWIERPDAGFVVWLVRGTGTAVMHAGTSAVIALVAKARSGERGVGFGPVWLLGVAPAVILHSAYNHFVLSPVLSAIAVVLLVPPAVVYAFEWAERRVERWLRVGFDADTEMLELILTGRISDSPVGEYLASLRGHFRPETVVDLLCYLRIRLELSLKAKGMMLMREAGFEPEPDPAVAAKLAELEFLERSIGPAGRLALGPFLRDDGAGAWEQGVLRSREG